MPTAPQPTVPRTAEPRPAWFRQQRPQRKLIGEKLQRTKRRIAERDRWTCCACGVIVGYSTSHLDHIVALAHGGGDDDGNLQTLCIRCSELKTASESRQGRERSPRHAMPD